VDKRILEIIKDDPENDYLNWYNILASKENLNTIPPDLMLIILNTNVGTQYFGIGNKDQPMTSKNFINLLLHNYNLLTMEIIDILKDNMEFIHVATNAFGMDDVLIYCEGFMLSLREHILRGRQAFVEELVIKYYKTFIITLTGQIMNRVDKSIETTFEFLYYKFVDNNPSDEMKVFFKLH